MKVISRMTEAIIKQPLHLTNKQIAEMLGTTAKCVQEARYRHGIKDYSKKSPGLSKKRHSPEDIKMIYEMIEQGKPYKQISIKTGMSIGGVCYHAKKIGHHRCAAEKECYGKPQKRSVHKNFALIRELALTDMTLREIAAAANCSESTAFLHRKHALAAIKKAA